MCVAFSLSRGCVCSFCSTEPPVPVLLWWPSGRWRACVAAAATACAQRSDGVRRASRARVLRTARAPRDEQFRALEHPAHRFTLPCCRRQPPVRVRPRAVPLAPARRRFASGVPMQNARISLHAAAFGARSASEQLSEVPNQQQTRLQHPSSWSITSLEVARQAEPKARVVLRRLIADLSAKTEPSACSET